MNVVGGFIQYGAFAFGLTLFTWSYLDSYSVDITGLYPADWEKIVSSDELCSLHESKYGLAVSGSSLNIQFWISHFLSNLSLRSFFQFIGEQLRVKDVIEEVFLSKRFWILISFAMMCTGSVHTFIRHKTNSLISNPSNRERLDKEELSMIGTFTSGYSLEKLAVLTFCVMRAYSPPNNKQYVDFGEYVKDHISLKSRLTDLSLMACWFTLLFAVEFVNEFLLFRFVKIVPLVTDSVTVTRLRYNSSFVSMFITTCAASMFSGVLFGSAIITFNFLHPIYATILVLESYRAFLRSLYTVNRLSVIFSTRKMNELEQQENSLTPLEVAKCVVSVQNCSLRHFHQSSTRFASFLLNMVYAMSGLVFTRRVFAIRFLLESFHNFKQLIGISDNGN